MDCPKCKRPCYEWHFCDEGVDHQCLSCGWTSDGLESYLDIYTENKKLRARVKELSDLVISHHVCRTMVPGEVCPICYPPKEKPKCDKDGPCDELRKFNGATFIDSHGKNAPYCCFCGEKRGE